MIKPVIEMRVCALVRKRRFVAHPRQTAGLFCIL